MLEISTGNYFYVRSLYWIARLYISWNPSQWRRKLSSKSNGVKLMLAAINWYLITIWKELFCCIVRYRSGCIVWRGSMMNYYQIQCWYTSQCVLMAKKISADQYAQKWKQGLLLFLSARDCWNIRETSIRCSCEYITREKYHSTLIDTGNLYPSGPQCFHTSSNQFWHYGQSLILG